MSQVLHIFRKDTRRLWVEILMWLFALSLYALLYPSRWDYSAAVMRSQYLYVLLPVLLVPAASWLLITRVIHAESLVGDGQWWLTRPYEKGSLLGAKALFIAAWIYLPFVVAEATILKEGLLSPFGHLAGWLHLLAIASAYGILPLIAIAASTANFARTTLTLFGAIGVWMGATALASISRTGYESNVPYDHSIWIVLVVIAGATIAIVTQFATRRVWFARAAAIGTVVLATGIGMLLAATRQREIDRDYPAADASATSPMQLAFETNGHPGWAGTVRTVSSERQDKIYVAIPIVFSGVAESSAVQVDNVKATLDDQTTDQSWTTPWWASRTMRFLPGEHHASVQIMLDRDQYERFRSAPVTLHLALAVTQLRANASTTATITSGDFPVNGFGVCSGQWLYRFPAQLMCRSSVLEAPAPTLLSTVWSRLPDSEAYVPPGPITAINWADDAYNSGEVYRLLPVWSKRTNLFPVSIHGRLSSTDGLELAPGTPVHFTQYAVTGRTQVSLTIPNFQLPPEPR